MRKIITFFAFALTILLQANAQEQWNAVKVFDLDIDDAASVYNMYIDSVGTTDGGAVFCFQSDSKLIKTDFNGEVIDETVNPYKYFAILNGDTIIGKEDAHYATNVINVTTGDTIYKTSSWIFPNRISTSSSGIYVSAMSAYRDRHYAVINCLSGALNITGVVHGLCCSGKGVYVLEYSTLTYIEANRKVKTTHSVPDPKGIAEYRGILYVYSQTDKAVYRLESAGGTSVVWTTQWNAVKVFDLDTVFADSVYNMYIDSVRTTNGDAVFCFQSDSNLIRTDFNGKLINKSVNPYKYFAILNGDTLITERNGVKNVTSGDYIFKTSDWYSYGPIAASSSGIYVSLYMEYVLNCLNNKAITTGRIYGLCCSRDGVYILGNNWLTFYDANNRDNATHSVPDPYGIAEYRGSLYVYSRTEKAVYRLESLGETTVVKSSPAHVLQTVYYNLLGEKIDSPSGLTIVITRFSDGSTKTEKQLFR